MPYSLADICCCAGLAADGYHLTGAQVEGFDIRPQPDYPFPFHLGDGIAYLKTDDAERFDAIHTSWPCQLFTTAKHLRKAQGSTSKESVDLLTPGLELLRTRWAHKPWVAENVDDNTKAVRGIMAPRPGEWLTMLCGSMFGLQVQRHRLFLTNFPVAAMACDHSRFPLDPVTLKPRPWGLYHVPGDSIPSGGRTARNAEHGRQVMGSWRSLPWDSLKEGIPPAFSAYIGAHLVAHLAR